MKKLITFFFIAAAVVSCGPKKIAKEFGQALQNALVTGNREEISRLYPSVTDRDVLQFSFDENTLKARKDKDAIVAQYSDALEVRLTRQGKKDWIASSSRGMFVFPEWRLKMAEPLGWYNPNLTDQENSLRLSDAGYDIYLEKEFVPKNAQPLQIGKFRMVKDSNDDDSRYGWGTGYGYLPVINTSDSYINASDYCIGYTLGLYYGDDDDGQIEDSWEGKDIPPHGTVQFEILFTTHTSTYNEHIVYKISTAEILQRFYKAQGNEYSLFEAEFGSLSSSPFPNAPVGPKIFSGKIGANAVNGNLSFDGNYFSGSYGYRGKTSGINVEGQLRSGGRFSAVERNKKGEVCGYYFGQFTQNSLTGNFKNKKGQAFNFMLTLK